MFDDELLVSIDASGLDRMVLARGNHNVIKTPSDHISLRGLKMKVSDARGGSTQ